MRHASRPRGPNAGPLFRAAYSHIGDSPSKRRLQEHGRAGRRSRLKIQAGCRPVRSWGANSWNDAETPYPDLETAIVAAIERGIAWAMKDRKE
jgi:hypothetical protein